MRFKKPKALSNDKRADARTEAVFNSFQTSCIKLYEILVDALQQTGASEAVKAQFSSDFEEAMSLRRKLFAEIGGTFTPADVKSRLPNNVWLKYETEAAKVLGEKITGQGFSETDRKTLFAEAERIMERKKHM